LKKRLKFVHGKNDFVALSNIKGTNLNQFLKLNNILLFLTYMCVKMYYFNAKLVIEKKQSRLINPFLG